MGDLKPPRSVGDDRETLLLLLQYQRDSLVRKVDEVSDADARRSLVPTGTSLLWLVNHLAGAEVLWVLRRFAGEDVPLPPEAASVDDAVAQYRRVWALVADAVDGASLGDLCRGLDPGEPATNLRWVLAHLLEETARHAGHADILRELIDGQTGR